MICLPPTAMPGPKIATNRKIRMITTPTAPSVLRRASLKHDRHHDRDGSRRAAEPGVCSSAAATITISLEASHATFGAGHTSLVRNPRVDHGVAQVHEQ